MASMASADTQEVSSASAAHGHGLWLEGLGLDVAGTASSLSEYPDNAGPNAEALNVEALGALQVDLGSVQLPLIGDGTNDGLLQLGSLDGISSWSASASDTRSAASSGLINADGSLDLDAGGEGTEFEPARVDLSGLLRQVLDDAVVNDVLSEASIGVGALGAHVEADNAPATSEYMLTGLGLDVNSPLVGGLTGQIDSLVGTLVAPIEDALGEGGELNTAIVNLVNALDALPLVDAELTSFSIDTASLTTEVREALLQTPLENADGSVSVDLSSGIVHVDLDELVIDRSGAESLSSLPANTDVLDDATITAILDGVSDALIGAGENSLVTKTVGLITDGLYGTAVDLDLEVGLSANVLGADIPVANGPVTVDTTIGGLLGDPDYAAPVVDVSGVTLLPGLPVPIQIGPLLQPVVDLLTSTLTTIGGEVLDPLVTEVIAGAQPALLELLGPVVAELGDGALEPLLSNIATITINEQPSEAGGEGDFGGDSFTVRALALSLLPNATANGAVALQLGSATVQAEVVEAALTATPDPVEPGGIVTLVGTGFEPGEDVTITLPDGSTTTVTADTDGAVTTTWDVPADIAEGDITFTALGATSGREASDTITVAADADANVNASASASASANAAADNEATASAQAAAEAAALADNTSTASASADVTANAAASAAADPEASAAASAESNTAAAASAQASADSTADSAQDADTSAAASAAANADASSAAEAASEASAEATASANASAAASADMSADASSGAAAQADANLNASASASASANAAADNEATASAQAAAEAAALADNTSTASAAADVTANSAASAAANAEASAAASAESNTAAAASAQASADSTADSAQNADTSAAASAAANADASSAAEAASEASAAATASTNASASASADVNAAASSVAAAQANASASAGASANGNADGNELVRTGGESLAALGLAALALLLAGGGTVVAMQRRAAKTR